MTAVLAWTAPDIVTRFARDGGRRDIHIPVRAIASELAQDAIRIVDATGTLHEWTPDGVPVARTPLLEPTTVVGAAVAGDLVAILDGDLAWLHRHGRRLAWYPERRLDGFRETGVTLSRGGDRVALTFETWTIGTENGSVGSSGLGLRMYDIAEHEHYYDWDSVYAHVSVSDDGEWLVSTDGDVDPCLTFHTSARELLVTGELVRLRFVGARLVVLLRDRVEVHDARSGRVARLALPEQFTDARGCGDDLVLIEPELGAWWIPFASLTFEDG